MPTRILWRQSSPPAPATAAQPNQTLVLHNWVKVVKSDSGTFDGTQDIMPINRPTAAAPDPEDSVRRFQYEYTRKSASPHPLGMQCTPTPFITERSLLHAHRARMMQEVRTLPPS